MFFPSAEVAMPLSPVILQKGGILPTPLRSRNLLALVLGTVCVEPRVRSQLVGHQFSRTPSALRGSGSCPSQVRLWLGPRSCDMCLSLETSLADHVATPASSWSRGRAGLFWDLCHCGPFRARLSRSPQPRKQAPPGVRRGPAPSITDRIYLRRPAFLRASRCGFSPGRGRA